MKLAYVIITLTSPQQYAGEEWITQEPVPCVSTSEELLALFLDHGFEANARCVYTFAPEESPRPQPRKETK